MKKQLLKFLFGVVIILFLIAFFKIAVNSAKRDAEFIKDSTTPEKMEKLGESVGRTSETLKEKKDAFVKGYKSVKKDSVKNGNRR